MKKYAFANAKTEDLWNVLTEVSGVEVNTIMEIWTKQKGYPVISVELKDRVLKFEQVHIFIFFMVNKFYFAINDTSPSFVESISIFWFMF